ncbi:glycosyltransferase family 2 protein [Leptolyngbyaceae cyanobacterium UHCC 1019]
MSESPLVSILINNYNYGHFLGDAIDSALNQIYPHVEVIIVDDGSIDDSRQVIAQYGDRIKSILKENGGQASAFNTGFLASRGQVICLLDSDDMFLPTKIQRVVEILGNQQELGWCFHSLTAVNTEGSAIIADEEYFPQKIRYISSKQDVRSQMLWGKLGSPFIIPATSGLCFTRLLLSQILPMPEEKEVSLSDSYIKFVALGLSAGFILKDELALQRLHGNNLFTGQKDHQKSAKIHILTAYWMKVNFPQLSRFANNIFAAGVKEFKDHKRSTSTVEPDVQECIRKYFAIANLTDRIQILSKLFYYRFKS